MKAKNKNIVLKNSNKKNTKNDINKSTPKNMIKEAKKQDPQSETMKVEIVEKGETKEDAKRFGLLRQNRPIMKTNVVNFLQIINDKKYDDSFPIITAEATTLLKSGYELIDLAGNPIDETTASEYLIVLDGQHRIIAFSKLNAVRSKEDQIIIPNIIIKELTENVGEYLASINLAGHSWTSSDKICVSSIITENKLLERINELIKEGFNATTAVLICIGKRLTAQQIKKMLSKKDTTMLPKGIDLEKAMKRANNFYTICMAKTGMTTKILTKRFFIKGFNSYAKATSDEQAFEALKQLTLSDFESIKEDDEFIEILKFATKIQTVA